MKITFIQPAILKRNYSGDLQWELTRPLALHFLAASIKQNTNFDIEIIDFENKKYQDVPIESIFKNNNSEIFAITSTTYTRFEAINLVIIIKKMFPESLIIVGGVHFMNAINDTLNNIDEIDIVVHGEGEIPVVEIAKAVEQKTSLEMIEGISYRNGEVIVHNKGQTVFENINDLPEYDNFSYQEYPEFVFGSSEKIPAISIMASRGCPNRCIFCSKSGSKYRLKNPQKVIEEIHTYKNKFHIGGFNFLDLTFTANSNHVKTICEKITQENLNIKWWCESRVNIPLELLTTMKDAGCVSIAIGVESGSQKILDKLSKKITIDQVIGFCKKCDELNIVVSAMFIALHPDETKEDLLMTFDLMEKLNKMKRIRCSIQPMMIFPGTDLEVIAKARKLLPEDFSWTKPYENKQNFELGQLSNVPLFIPSNELLNYYVKCNEQKMMEENVNEIMDNYTLKEICVKVTKYFINTGFSEYKRYLISPLWYKKVLKKIFEKIGSSHY